MFAILFDQQFLWPSQQSLNSDKSEANPLKLPWLTRFISLTCVLTFYGLDIVRLFIYSLIFLWTPFNKMKWTVKRFLFSFLFLLLLCVSTRFWYETVGRWFTTDVTSRILLEKFALWSELTLIALNSFTYRATIADRVFQLLVHDKTF